MISNHLRYASRYEHAIKLFTSSIFIASFPGILASMTVALAMNGCSLVELHAAMAVDVSHDKHAVSMDDDHEGPEIIQDVFYVGT